MNGEVANNLSRRFKVPLPLPKEIRKEFWSTSKAGKKGALLSYQKYGNPGTQEGRRKGGLRSGLLRRLYPERYPKGNLNRINKMPHSLELAELIGIILGDGSLTRYQLSIYFNASTDKEYALYVSALINRLVGLKPYWKIRENFNCIMLRVSSAELIRFLVLNGQKIGDKIKNGSTIPDWIINNRDYAKACLRGLIDTDGNIARKNYHARTLAMQITFTSHSIILLKQVRDILNNNGFTPSKITRSQIHLTRKADVRKYIKEIGFNNPKHLQRYKNYLLCFSKC